MPGPGLLLHASGPSGTAGRVATSLCCAFLCLCLCVRARLYRPLLQFLCVCVFHSLRKKRQGNWTSHDACMSAIDRACCCMQNWPGSQAERQRRPEFGAQVQVLLAMHQAASSKCMALVVHVTFWSMSMHAGLAVSSSCSCCATTRPSKAEELLNLLKMFFLENTVTCGNKRSLCRYIAAW